MISIKIPVSHDVDWEDLYIFGVLDVAPKYHVLHFDAPGEPDKPVFIVENESKIDVIFWILLIFALILHT